MSGIQKSFQPLRNSFFNTDLEVRNDLKGLSKSLSNTFVQIMRALLSSHECISIAKTYDLKCSAKLKSWNEEVKESFKAFRKRISRILSDLKYFIEFKPRELEFIKNVADELKTTEVHSGPEFLREHFIDIGLICDIDLTTSINNPRGTSEDKRLSMPVSTPIKHRRLSSGLPGHTQSSARKLSGQKYGNTSQRVSLAPGSAAKNSVMSKLSRGSRVNLHQALGSARNIIDGGADYIVEHIQRHGSSCKKIIIPPARMQTQNVTLIPANEGSYPRRQLLSVAKPPRLTKSSSLARVLPKSLGLRSCKKNIQSNRIELTTTMAESTRQKNQFLGVSFTPKGNRVRMKIDDSIDEKGTYEARITKDSATHRYLRSSSRGKTPRGTSYSARNIQMDPINPISQTLAVTGQGNTTHTENSKVSRRESFKSPVFVVESKQVLVPAEKTQLSNRKTRSRRSSVTPSAGKKRTKLYKEPTESGVEHLNVGILKSPANSSVQQKPLISRPNRFEKQPRNIRNNPSRLGVYQPVTQDKENYDHGFSFNQQVSRKTSSENTANDLQKYSKTNTVLTTAPNSQLAMPLSSQKDIEDIYEVPESEFGLKQQPFKSRRMVPLTDHDSKISRTVVTADERDLNSKVFKTSDKDNYSKHFNTLRDQMPEELSSVRRDQVGRETMYDVNSIQKKTNSTLRNHGEILNAKEWVSIII